MPVLNLPSRPRRATLRAFCIAAGAAAALAAAAVARSPGATGWTVSSLTAAAALAAAGAARPSFARPAYRLWNRLAAAYGRLARAAVVRACQLAVIAPAGAIGSMLRPVRPAPGASMWVAHRASGSRVRAAEAGGWLRRYVARALRAREYWLVLLVPYLVLLSALGAEREAGTSENLYTLY